MEKEELKAPLQLLPPVDFCCAYGSSLLPQQNPSKENQKPMVDYILGVSDPQQWHSQNLEMNRDHYASLTAFLGSKAITRIADLVGVGVHFNPFVLCGDKMIKYGVIRMHDLVQDLLNWERFYLSGRLQKPVTFLVDNLDIEDVNSVNLRAATSAALLLLPPEFTEEDLYLKICSLSYAGDLRMLFAEDRNKVKKIVQGNFSAFQALYKPYLSDLTAKELLKIHPFDHCQTSIQQDCGLSAARTLVDSLPPVLRGRMGVELGETHKVTPYGRVIPQVVVNSREEAAKCMQKVARRLVMVSSVRQAISGVLTTGGINAARYLASKMSKAWKSRE